MVTRKSSFPLSNSGSLAVDSADVPPIPHPPRDDRALQLAASYIDVDNPWNDPPSSSQLRAAPPLPAFLQPRNGKPVESPPEKQPLHAVPAALRPGVSGQDTPRSSVDSGQSRDFWEDDEVPHSASPSRKNAGFAHDYSSHNSNHNGNSNSNSNSNHNDNDYDHDWTHVDVPPIPTQLPPPPPPFSTSSVKRKPVATHLSPHSQPSTDPYSADFASLNPFRRPSGTDSEQEGWQQPLPYSAHSSSDNLWPTGKGKQPVRDPIDTDADVPVNQFSNMHLSHTSSAEQVISDPWRPMEPTAPPPPPPTGLPPPPPIPQPEILPTGVALRGDHKDELLDPWAPSPPDLSSPPSFDQSQKESAPFTDGILGRSQDTGVISYSDEQLDTGSRADLKLSEQSLLDYDAVTSPPSHGATEQVSEQHRATEQVNEQHREVYEPPPGPPPLREPRPVPISIPLSEAEIAKNIEDRSETYQIKHFNWFDHTSGRLRSSSMLVQNKNGPCPLLALVNALILGAKEESQAALDDALRSREQVSIGLIIETLMYELITRGAESGAELPDVDALNAFLMRLKTGMNANPRFVASNSPPNLMDAEDSALNLPQAERLKRKAGSFESTSDMNLYGSFAVPLLHGWLPEPGSTAEAAFRRSAQTYEDAQALQFNEEELEYKLTTSGLSSQEQTIWEDITAIKGFLQQHPTQLTPYGLDAVRESLPSGSFAIMFRNDHFSTIYKHPQSGQLFTLITDAGYAERDEIIWESLVDITGAGNDYFSGDFRYVSHDQARSRNASDSSAVPDNLQHASIPNAALPLTPQEQQEQHDADFAMALQLQEEEEQKERAAKARRMRSGAQQSGQTRRSPRSSTSNIPITLTPVPSRSDNRNDNRSDNRSGNRSANRSANRSNNRSDESENRPVIPPRAGRSGNGPPAVNRPSDALDDDAPPAYEEAAKVKPYIPPVGSPLHPTYSSGTGSSGGQLSGTTGPVHPPGPNAPYISATGPPLRGGGRPSTAARRPAAAASTENSRGRTPSHSNTSGPVSQGARSGRSRVAAPAEERDCTIM